MAAVLAGGDGAVLSHRSAAALWGFVGAAGTRHDVTTTRSHKGPDGVRLHRTRRLAAWEVTTRERIPVSTPARTLLDLSEAVTPRILVRALEECERRDLLDVRAIERVIEANPGRRGFKALREALHDNVLGATLTRSGLEEAFLALVADLGLPAPLVNVRVGAYEVDFLWREHGFAVETDHHRYHRTRAEFERDRAKDLDLRAAGLAVARFSDRQVARRDARVERALRAGLRRRSRR
jgi:hypothetical protein